MLRHTKTAERTAEVLLIADDLTGALDSTACFAARGMNVVVARSPGALAEALAQGADVVAVSTNTREIPAGAARAVLAEVAEMIDGHKGLLFKKVDSRLKGPVAAELDGLIGSQGRVWACPALPREGRWITGGQLHGGGLATPVDIREVLGRDADMPEIGTGTAPEALLPGDLKTPTALVGASAMAEALARRLRPGRPATGARPLPRPLLIAIGSRDPITVAQVDRLPSSMVTVAPGGRTSCTPREDVTVLRLVDGPGEDPGSAFADTLADTIRAHRPAALLASGGETAQAVLDRLGVTLLAPEGEIAPGVAVARTLDGPSLRVATKSGGFGGADLLTSLIYANHEM